MKTVLLLGDSIRLSYQGDVARHLAGEARVVGPADNGRFALYTWMRLEAWLGEFGVPDVVHWNNGLWDLGQCDHRRPRQIPCADYLGNLGFILRRLQAAGACVIWRTITPVNPARGWRDGWYFDPTDVAWYNDAARSLMTRAGVPCHELGALLETQMAAAITEDGVHLTPAGQALAAASVADCLRAHL